MSNDLVEEYRAAMLHNDMEISHLMVHAQQVEETRLKRKNRESKRAKSYEGGTSKGRLEIQEKYWLKKRVSNQVPSNFPRLSRIVCLTLGTKMQRVVIHQARNLLVLSVLRSIWVNV